MCNEQQTEQTGQDAKGFSHGQDATPQYVAVETAFGAIIDAYKTGHLRPSVFIGLDFMAGFITGLHFQKECPVSGGKITATADLNSETSGTCQLIHDRLAAHGLACG